MHPIPREALDDRLGYFGTAGSGKTYGAGTAVERVLSDRSRCVIVDPLGVWWGLRLQNDGKTESKFDVVIFGGPHGDLPLTENAGALIGEAVATSKESCILDLSQLGTKAAERRFMLAFLAALYRYTPREPVHVIFDEADMWAPQRLMDKEGDAAKLLGMMETIVRRGRVKGFVPWLISQRTAVISKDVLSQIDGLVIFKLTSSQDRAAIGDWIDGQADKQQGKDILAALPAKQRGEAVVWIPGRGVLIEAPFPEKATFDSSRTPKRGEKLAKTGKLKELDVGGLKARLATVESEANANDPKALRAEIAALRAEKSRLERQSATGASKIADDPKKIEAAENRGFRKGFDEARNQGVTAFAGLRDAVATRIEQQTGFAKEVRRMRPTFMIEEKHIQRSGLQAPPAPNNPRQRGAATRPSVAATPSAAGRGDGTLPIGERAVLAAALQYDGVDRDQLSVLTGYKRSSRDAYIQRLRERGFVETQGQTVVPTDAGCQALPDFEPLPTGVALQDYWRAKLPEGERRILDVLIENFPNAVDRNSLDEATGYKRSSRDAYLQRLKSRGLISLNGSSVTAIEGLF